MKVQNGRAVVKVSVSIAGLWLGFSVLACNLGLIASDVVTAIEPTQIPEIGLGLGSVRGYVWDDLCARQMDNGALSPDCIVDAGSGRVLADGVFGEEESGIANVQVSIGKGSCPSRGYTEVMTNAEGFYQINDLVAGEYCVSVELPGGNRMAKIAPGVWTYPRSERGVGVGWTSLTLHENEVRYEVNFGWFSYLQPLSPDNKPANTFPKSEACSNQATFLKDVTIADGTRVSPGEHFTKVWRIRNEGTCIWNSDYSLYFVEGDRMNAPSSVELEGEVPPHEWVDLEVVLTAPEEDGSYQGFWMLKGEYGEAFGIGDAADKPFWVKIKVGEHYSRESVVSWEYETNPENLAPEGRWIDVDLSDQLLTAYRGSTAIMRFVISSGTASTPTVTGQFRIWVKLASTDMSGPGYDLEDVPYTMYFYRGYGLHGTYWHENFGTPMSHGCVNLRTSDASWLFDFASEGTLVNIHP